MQQAGHHVYLEYSLLDPRSRQISQHASKDGTMRELSFGTRPTELSERRAIGMSCQDTTSKRVDAKRFARGGNRVEVSSRTGNTGPKGARQTSEDFTQTSSVRYLLLSKEILSDAQSDHDTDRNFNPASELNAGSKDAESYGLFEAVTRIAGTFSGGMHCISHAGFTAGATRWQGLNLRKSH